MKRAQRIGPIPERQVFDFFVLSATATVRVRVQAARDLQRARFAGTSTSVNARMTHSQLREHCVLDSALGDLLQQAIEKLSLSARAYHRILKVARTIADLAGTETIGAPHLLEAIQYRTLDRTSQDGA